MSETKMQLEDWLDDLCVRFIINLPREELESVERICFQVEEAQWFYEDFIRPLDPALPSLSLKAFALRIFQHCPLMSQWSHYHHITAFSEFLAYKTRVPVRGAIMLNQDMDEVVLVKGWKKGANWSFPRGKINKDEKDLDCAIREVYEETGFDIREAGLVKDESEMKFIEITMREQHMRLYVFRGVPRDTHFEPRTRKEISKIEWYKLSELPTLKKSKQHDQGFAVANANKFYMVAPFMNPLKKWIAQQRKADTRNHAVSKQMLHAEGETSMDEAMHTANDNLMPAPSTIEMATPSDLPEVASSQDISSHLKRLLNIKGMAPPQEMPQSAEPLQTSTFDSSKSNALLALLRNGSHNIGRQPPRVDYLQSQTAPPANIAQPQFDPITNLFRGLPQNDPYSGPSGQPVQDAFSRPIQSSPQVPLPSHHGSLAHVPPTNFPPMNHNYPSLGHPGHPAGYHGASQIPSQHISRQPYRDVPMPVSSQAYPPSQRPAPYQRTGDPQFSQPGQQQQIQGATIPPASKLPPPKLTSHSLALLSVFKDTPKTPKTPGAAIAPNSEKGPVVRRQASQHQDHLLNLLKGSPLSNSLPAELSGRSVPSVSKHILQRPRNEINTSTQLAEDSAKTSTGPAQTSATVSGPLNMPYFDAIAKPSGKKLANGPNRQAKKERQTQTQPLASPITILARPQSAKRDTSVPTAPATQTPSKARTEKPKNVEPPKPFQPQILRRGEKPQFDMSLPEKTIAIQVPNQSSDFSRRGSASRETEPQIQFDRRPSQTAAQKETLLSLFGKASASPSSSPAPQLDLRPSTLRPSAASALVSPLSPSQPLSNVESVSGGGTPSDGDAHTPTANRVASPVNKAFLLGFLEGVAKGNK